MTGRFRSVLTHIKKEVSKKKRNDTKKKFVSDDPFTFLWSKIIGIVSRVACEFDQQWQKRQRIINTLLLILFIFRLVFSKNKQGYQTTVIELWEQCAYSDEIRHLIPELSATRFRSYPPPYAAEKLSNKFWLNLVVCTFY